MMSELKACPFCGKKLAGTKDLFAGGTSWSCPDKCIERMKQPMPEEEFFAIYNTRPIEDALRSELEAWKADAERLANHLSMLKFASLEFRDEIDADLDIHHALVEKEKKCVTV